MHRSTAALFIGFLILTVLPFTAVAQSSSYGDAMGWYEREAAKGSAKAQYLLGLLYERGAGQRPRDAEKAFGWFARAAEQGHAEAQYKVGRAYQFGTGIDADPGQAILWYRRAAGQGISEAQHNLAYMLENAIATTRSPDEAVRWYREAARNGFGPSQLALGSVYMRGAGVDRDLAEAWARLRAAESRKVSAAADARLAIEKTMTAAQMSQARELAKPRLAR